MSAVSRVVWPARRTLHRSAVNRIEQDNCGERALTKGEGVKGECWQPASYKTFMFSMALAASTSPCPPASCQWPWMMRDTSRLPSLIFGMDATAETQVASSWSAIECFSTGKSSLHLEGERLRACMIGSGMWT